MSMPPRADRRSAARMPYLRDDDTPITDTLPPRRRKERVDDKTGTMARERVMRCASVMPKKCQRRGKIVRVAKIALRGKMALFAVMADAARLREDARVTRCRRARCRAMRVRAF